jgi:hypothetical protein
MTCVKEKKDNRGFPVRIPLYARGLFMAVEEEFRRGLSGETSGQKQKGQVVVAALLAISLLDDRDRIAMRSIAASARVDALRDEVKSLDALSARVRRLLAATRVQDDTESEGQGAKEDD